MLLQYKAPNSRPHWTRFQTVVSNRIYGHLPPMGLQVESRPKTSGNMTHFSEVTHLFTEKNDSLSQRK